MIYIENNSTDPAYNLAFEEYIFKEYDLQDEAVFMLWQNEPSVIVGKYQNTLEEINYDYVRENGIHVIRRNTGGGAVYHDLGNLNYTLVIPGADHTRVDFGTFTAPVVKALRSAGIDAEQSGRNDILAGGRKFSGNAQHISRGRLLHHGTLMFDVDTENVAAALRVKEGKFRSKATKSVRSRVTNLKPLFEAAGTNVGEKTGQSNDGSCARTVADFKALLIEWFDREYGLEPVTLSDEQLDSIMQLKKEKYDSYEWNFGRSPEADIVRGGFFRCGQVEFHLSIKQHRISALKIRGDFFSSLDIEDLEKTLTGIPYEKEPLYEALSAVDLHAYLGDITAEELVEKIV